MIKHYRFFLIALVATIMMGCQTQNYADTYVEFHPQHQPYKVWIPKDWKIKEHQKSGTVKATQPQSQSKGAFQANLTIATHRGSSTYKAETGTMESQKVELESFAEGYLKNLKSRHNISTEVLVRSIKVNGQDARLLDLDYMGDDQRTALRSSVYLVHYDTVAYILRFTAEKAHFGNHQATFDEMINSFKMK